MVLDVVDDGARLRRTAPSRSPEQGHFGLQVIADLASAMGALLQVASAPGRGTHWRLVVAASRRRRRSDR